MLCIAMTTTLMCCHSNTTGNIVVTHMTCAMHALMSYTCTHTETYIQLKWSFVLFSVSVAEHLHHWKKLGRGVQKKGSQIL